MWGVSRVGGVCVWLYPFLLLFCLEDEINFSILWGVFLLDFFECLLGMQFFLENLKLSILPYGRGGGGVW